MADDAVRRSGGTPGDYAWRDAGRERSMGEVLKDIFGNVQEMIRSELRLARVEMKEEVGKTISSAKLLAIGGVLALLTAVYVLVTITLALALFMPMWAACLVMTVALGLPGFLLIAKGRQQLTMPTPHKTIDTVKENVEWMKNQTKS